LNRQRIALLNIHASLKRAGALVFAENLIASAAHRVLRSAVVPWGRRWRYVSERELRGFLAPFVRVDLRSVGLLGAFGRTERQRQALGRLDRRFDRAIPASWRYVGIGVASKGS
jgi:hypothetical protein